MRNLLRTHYHLEMTNLQRKRAISVPNQPFKSHSAWFRPLARPLNSAESSVLEGLRQLIKLGYGLAKFVFIDSHHQDRVQHLPEQSSARSQEVTSLKMWNRTCWVGFTDPRMLGREGQLCNPGFYRFALLSYRIVSFALSIWFEMTLSLSFLLSNNHSLLFLSLLSSSSTWLIISESQNLHTESHLHSEKAIFNKILVRNVQLLQSVGFHTFQRGN